MPSTRKRTLMDLLPGLNGQTTRYAQSVATHHQSCRLSITVAATIPVAFFTNPSELIRVAFVPDAAFATSGTDFYTLKVVDKGTNGAGNTQLGTTFDLSVGSFAADVEQDLFNALPPKVPQYQVASDVLSIVVTRTGAPAAISGFLVVDYIPTF